MVEEPEYFESSGDSLMAELFLSIGYEVSDDGSYQMLAEYTESQGEHSEAHRGAATLHGWCWKIGDGLEIWSVIYEHDQDMCQVDCRPAFRGRYVHHIQPWELIEFDEDGEALVRGGLADGTEIIFELQNLTEVRSPAFREPSLHVSIAGLAYKAVIHSSAKSKLVARFDLAETLPEFEDNACESDYLICGRVLAWKEIANPDTAHPLAWMFVDSGKARLEILVNRRALRGRPRVGAFITAHVWLQGHVLEDSDLFARYEGVDWDFSAGDFWARLRRDN
jgi:hypothetical protein